MAVPVALPRARPNRLALQRKGVVKHALLTPLNPAKSMDCRADQHRIRASINTRFAFAPYPVAIEGLLYRIHVVFESSHGDLFCVGTDLMATDLDAADSMCDALNSHVDLNREQWKCLASAVFATVEMAKEHAASETEAAARGGAITTCDPDEPW